MSNLPQTVERAKLVVESFAKAITDTKLVAPTREGNETYYRSAPNEKLRMLLVVDEELGNTKLFKFEYKETEKSLESSKFDINFLSEGTELIMTGLEDGKPLVVTSEIGEEILSLLNKALDKKGIPAIENKDVAMPM